MLIIDQKQVHMSKDTVLSPQKSRGQMPYGTQQIIKRNKAKMADSQPITTRSRSNKFLFNSQVAGNSFNNSKILGSNRDSFAEKSRNIKRNSSNSSQLYIANLQKITHKSLQQFQPLQTQHQIGQQMTMPMTQAQNSSKSSLKNSPDRRKNANYNSEKKLPKNMNYRSNPVGDRISNELNLVPKDPGSLYTQRQILIEGFSREHSQKRGTCVVKPKQTRNSNVP